MTDDPMRFVRQRMWLRTVSPYLASTWANWTWANTLSIVSIVISVVVARYTLVKVTAAELSILSWEVQPEEPQGTYLKVSAAVSNTGDKQLVIVAAGFKALGRNGQTKSAEVSRKSEGADRVQLEPGKISVVEVYIPVSKSLFKIVNTPDFRDEWGNPECGTAPHYAAVVDVLLFGVDGDYRGATAPKLCIYLKDGKIAGVRKFRGSGSATVLPWDSYTFRSTSASSPTP